MELKIAPQVDPADLTGDQKLAIDAVLDWIELRDTREMTMGGYAGTGKTTVIRQLLTMHLETVEQHIHGFVAVAAFTGKAASVLRAKGLPAQTLHSLIYKILRVKRGTPEFGRKDGIDVGMVVVDESSMINSTLYRDLMAFGVPVLWVGDMGQLEPIGDNPDLMADPDVVLEKIHRQAELSDIIRLSVGVRKNFSPAQFYPTTDEVVIGDRGLFNASLLGADIVICGYNKTRHNTNRKIRKALGFKTLLEPGERVICLRNDKDQGVFNGMICVVKEVKEPSELDPDFMEVKVEDDAGNVMDVRMFCKQFGSNDAGKELDFGDPRGITLWDYGYCITAHKAQGSEWSKVLVMEELHPNWNASRWRYTAITRAAKQLVYCF